MQKRRNMYKIAYLFISPNLFLKANIAQDLR